MNNLIKIRLKLLFAVFSCSFLLFSCSSPSIEEQIEELIETNDMSDRAAIAESLADSLSPKAVELLVGLKPNYYATEALDNMLARYPVIATDASSQEIVLRCIFKMQTPKSAAYLGRQAMVSDQQHLAFGLLCGLPSKLKKEALISGLKQENKLMQDSLIAEFYALGMPAIDELLDNPTSVSGPCLKKIIWINLNNSQISKELKWRSITSGLTAINDDEEFKVSLVNASKVFGTAPINLLFKDWVYNKDSEEILNAIKAFGPDAMVFLASQLGSDNDAAELLARIGKPAVGSLIAQMRNSSQKVRFAAADALVLMLKYNPDAISDLTQAFDNGSLGAIAGNYPFYIRLGQQGSENLLLNALSAYFNREMCLDYLNCGNQAIEGGSKKIAEARGYNIFSKEGTHDGPKWGSGN